MYVFKKKKEEEELLQESHDIWNEIFHSKR